MAKKLAAFFVVLAAATILAAPVAHARRGADNPPEPPECQVEDGGIVVCK